MGELIDGAMQQAAQAGRQCMGWIVPAWVPPAAGYNVQNADFVQILFMHTLPLSEFRANASAMLDLVEQGETVRILRHGKPIADLVPVREASATDLPSWKRPFTPEALPEGVSAVAKLLEERDAASW